MLRRTKGVRLRMTRSFLMRAKSARLRMTMLERGLGEPRIFLSGDGREEIWDEVEG